MSQDDKYLLFQTKFWTFLCDSNFSVFSVEAQLSWKKLQNKCK